MPPNMGAPYQQSAQQQQPPSQPSEMDMNGDIWVETKTGDGKSYYYHAKTRETTWTKPEGPTVKILTQQQVTLIFFLLINFDELQPIITTGRGYGTTNSS
jgi:transcription elongation regulator 1